MYCSFTKAPVAFCMKPMKKFLHSSILIAILKLENIQVEVKKDVPHNELSFCPKTTAFLSLATVFVGNVS